MYSRQVVKKARKEELEIWIRKDMIFTKPKAGEGARDGWLVDNLWAAFFCGMKRQ